MITGIDRKSVTKELRKEGLPEYWGQYYTYEKDKELYKITEKAFLKEIEEERKKYKPYIDSKILISRILTEFGTKHIFHRLFNERFQDLHREQVLGMQLYKLIVDDKDVWIYYEIQHEGNKYPNATYFIDRVTPADA